MNSAELNEAVRRQMERLKLNPEHNPYMLAGTLEGLAEFVSKLEALEPGVTWRDVFPDIPAHWNLEDDETWTERFEPYGPFDYQQLPAGAAVIVGYADLGAGTKFNALVERARATGYDMYGAGIMYGTDGRESNWGIIVLKTGASPDAIHSLASWAEAQPDVIVARPDRYEDTEFVEGD